MSVLCVQYIFTAVPTNGGPSVTVASPSPEARFQALVPNTKASVLPARVPPS